MSPSFFDTYEDVGGGTFLVAEEKKVLAESKSPFVVNGVSKGEGFEGKGEAFILHVEIDGEPRNIGGFTIGSNVGSRDRQLAAMQRHFDEGGEPFEAYLYKSKRAFLIGEVRDGVPVEPGSEGE